MENSWSLIVSLSIKNRFVVSCLTFMYELYRCNVLVFRAPSFLFASMFALIYSTFELRIKV